MRRKDRRSHRAGLFLCCCLCCAIMGLRPASSEEFSDLPMGHLEIAEGDNGTIKVLARCVAAQPLLEDLAKRAGVTLEQPRPIQAYVSVGTRPRDLQFAEPFEWIDRVAYDVCLRAKKGDGNVVTLEMIAALYYDPFLIEEEVIAKYRTEISPQTPAEGIMTGLVIIDGHLIRPPYAIAWEKSGEYDAQITVNGVPWFTEYGVGPLDWTVAPDLPPSGQFDNLDHLRYYVSDRLYPRLLKTHNGDVAKTKADANAFINTQLIAKDLPIEDPTGRPKLKRDCGLFDIYPGNFEFSTGTCRLPNTRTPDLEETTRNTIARMRASLGRARILVGVSGREPASHGPLPQDASHEMLAMTPLSTLQRECLLTDTLGGRTRSNARVLAVNLLTEDYDFMLRGK